jgi:trigger factor
MPNIDKVENKDDALVYQATVEVYPEVEAKFEGLEVSRKSSEVTDKDVDAMLENFKSNVLNGLKLKAWLKKTCK